MAPPEKPSPPSETQVASGPPPQATAHPTGAQLDVHRGQSIGRFVVLGLIGRGGMGEVYGAYDPELDRKVAVKLLHANLSGANKGRALLLREAQALAKLQHPNVVVVYDVGTLGDSVFLAMEFIDGMTAGAWLKAERRTWRQALAVFVAAGRGLAAAHAAGMVHRDFKPENVMITRDGQVRVMDFGLARGVEEAPEDPPRELASTVGLSSADAAEAASEPVATIPLLHASLTRTGAQVGTPVYMAPEQFIPGGRVDARTNQFNFSVTLYEALYGTRPFAATDLPTLKLRTFGGKVAPPPPGSRVPPWIRRILLRGLQTRPEERYASMEELLAALEADPGVKRRRGALAAAGLTLLFGAALAAHRLGSTSRTMCDGGNGRLAGIWEPAGVASQRKEGIHRAFVGTGRSYAEAAFVSASRLLDGYVAQWAATYRDACQATHVRGEQSAEVLDLRMSCLNQRLTNVRALTDLLASADATAVENATSAAGALPALDGCSDIELLRAVVKPPESAASRREVESLREQLARMIALRDAGKCAAAETMAERLITAIRSTGYQPLLAEALLAAAFLGETCTDAPVALERYREAYWVALGARHDEVAARAAILIPAFISRDAPQGTNADEWLETAQAMLRRLTGTQLLEAWLEVSKAFVLRSRGDDEGSVRAFGHALALKEKLLGPDHPDSLVSSLDLGNALLETSRAQDALEVDERTRLGYVRVFGPKHPWVAFASNNMGEALNALGRPQEAIPAFQRSIEILQEAKSSPRMIAAPLTGLGLCLLKLGRPDEAIVPLEEAYRSRLDYAAPPKELAEVEFALARALRYRPAERSRSRSLALAAKRDYSLAKDPRALARVDAWLTGPGD